MSIHAHLARINSFSTRIVSALVHVANRRIKLLLTVYAENVQSHATNAAAKLIRAQLVLKTICSTRILASTVAQTNMRNNQ